MRAEQFLKQQCRNHEALELTSAHSEYLEQGHIVPYLKLICPNCQRFLVIRANRKTQHIPLTLFAKQPTT